MLNKVIRENNAQQYLKGAVESFLIMLFLFAACCILATKLFCTSVYEQMHDRFRIPHI